MLTEEERQQMLGQWNREPAADFASELDELSEEDLDAMLRDMTPKDGNPYE